MTEIEKIGVPEYYAGESVFITGGTGFIGKVFIEKLLRSCNQVKKVYVLIRAKKGVGIEDRIKNMYQLALFDVLRKERPGDFENKVIPLCGDARELNLGLSDHDRQIIIDNVGIIVHGAATVRFDQPLNDAILMNTRGTREICQIALELKRPKMVIHISTAYCHTDKKVVEEKTYPPHADWRKAIELAENLDRETMQKITPLYLAGFPNTYTFTKSLAESAICDMLHGVIPAIIYRPTIVVHSYTDPFPGWIDNFNGPVGLFVASGTGLNRISLVGNVLADYVPVDSVIKGMLIAMWHKGMLSDPSKRKEVTAHNAGSHGIQDVTVHQLINMSIEIAWDNSLSNTLWYPSTSTTTSVSVYYTYVILFHLLPAFFIDLILKAFNYKPMIVKLHRLIYQATMALKYFIFNEWVFDNKIIVSMENDLLEKDIEAFSYNAHDVDTRDFFRKALIGAKKYLLKEDMSQAEAHTKKFRMFYYVDCVAKFFVYSYAFYFFFIKHNIITFFWSCVTNYFDAL